MGLARCYKTTVFFTFIVLWPIFNFQDGGRPPSWICFMRVGTTHEEYLVVFVTVQNLVVIGAVISTTQLNSTQRALTDAGV